MIQVAYDRQSHTVCAQGHAGGVYGQDLVCAGVSTLMLTLAEVVEWMTPLLEDASIKLDSGDSMVSAEVLEEWDGVVALAFDSVCKGFQFLSREYPERVHYICKK